MIKFLPEERISWEELFNVFKINTENFNKS